MAKSSISFFDRQVFGTWISMERKLRGYTSADNLARDVVEKTGYPVTGRTILNLEAGKNDPCISLLMALSFTLSGSMFSDEMVKHIRSSGNAQRAAALAFPEYNRSEYSAIALEDSEVGIFVDSKDGGKWIIRRNPLNV